MKRILMALMLVLSIPIALMTNVNFAQAATSSITFDQLSTKFLAFKTKSVIPIGVTGSDYGAKLKFVSVSGLPGVKVQYVTDPVTLGAHAAAELVWIPTTRGSFTCKVTAQDTNSGQSITASFNVIVDDRIYNASPTLAPIGMQEVAANGTLFIPVASTRSFAPQGTPTAPTLSLKASGLPGTMGIDSQVRSTTAASGVVYWRAPSQQGLYLLNIEVRDAYGAYTTQQVPVIVGYGSSSNLALTFDQLSTKFLAFKTKSVIPIGVTGSDYGAKIKFVSVSGLPGVKVQYVTDPVTLGAHAAAELVWTPNERGNFTCHVTAQDTNNGQFITASFNVIVEDRTYSASPTLAPIGVQEVAANGTLFIPIASTRSFAPQGTPTAPTLSLKASGLPGTMGIDNQVRSTTAASGTVYWRAPSEKGVYLLNIEVSDAYGAYTTQQVPVIVGYGTPDLAMTFDQLSTKFLAFKTKSVIPIGVTGSDYGAKLKFVSVSGLPGVKVQYVTDPVTLGAHAAAELVWTPTERGNFICNVTAQDTNNGHFITASFNVIVEDRTYSASPTLAPIGVQEVAANGTLFIPIASTRSFAPQGTPTAPTLSLKASGLPGTMGIDNQVRSTTAASGAVYWRAPSEKGVYLLNIEVSDAYGAYTTQQVPVIVGYGTPDLAMTFDQLSTKFLAFKTKSVIPIGVIGSDYGAKIKFVSVSGLPGVKVQYVTDPVTLGSHAAVQLVWTPNERGSFTCTVTAQDTNNGHFITASFNVIVEDRTYSASPTLVPIGTQEVAANGTLFIPVASTRSFAPQGTPTVPKLSLKASGLPGTMGIDNQVRSTTAASGVVYWRAPSEKGAYLLNIEVSDAYGAYTIQQVPVIVGY